VTRPRLAVIAVGLVLLVILALACALVEAPGVEVTRLVPAIQTIEVTRIVEVRSSPEIHIVDQYIPVEVEVTRIVPLATVVVTRIVEVPMSCPVVEVTRMSDTVVVEEVVVEVEVPVEVLVTRIVEVPVEVPATCPPPP
jgi:hypothetical protein